MIVLGPPERPRAPPSSARLSPRRPLPKVDPAGTGKNMACTHACGEYAGSGMPPSAPLPPNSPGFHSGGIAFSRPFLVLLGSINFMLIGLIVTLLVRRRFWPPPVTAPTQQPVHKVPVDHERLRKLQAMLASLPVLTSLQAAELAPDCAICLADYADDERVATQLPCGHVFHSTCVEKWILYRPHAPNYGGSVVSALIIIPKHCTPFF